MNINHKSPPLKIIFAGTPEFAAVTLAALLKSPHQILAVYTQPDRPAGRGQKLTPSPVKQLALQHQIPVFQPPNLKNAEQEQQIKELNADVMVVVAYGVILPKNILALPKLGCVNVHASLLPRWRGAAPIQRAIMSGDQKTGVSIMQMDAGLDTGPVLYEVECSIHMDDTSQILHDRLADLGAKALLETLNAPFNASPQDSAHATYAHKITKDEAKIDWTLSADEIERKIRAFNPWPITFTNLNEHTIRIWHAKKMEEQKATTQKQKPGTILNISSAGIQVATGNEILVITQIQIPGGKSLSVKEFLNSPRDWLKEGAVFQSSSVIEEKEGTQSSSEIEKKKV